MNKKKKEEKKLISHKIRNYIYLWIFFSCSIIISNIHTKQSKIYNNNNEISISNSYQNELTYIFHDFYWNEFILNEWWHWSAIDLSFLLNEEIPEWIKEEDNNKTSSETTNNNPIKTWDFSIDLSNINIEESYKINENKTDNSITIYFNQDSQENIPSNFEKIDNSQNIKDNQISYEDILNQLEINGTQNTENNKSIEIELSEIFNNLSWNNEYITKELNNEWKTLIIEKNTLDNNIQWNENVDWLTFKSLTNWILVPILTPRNKLIIKDEIYEYIWNYYNWSSITYKFLKNPINWEFNNINDEEANTIDSRTITIINEYNKCKTPRWYKIDHWESVLAYQQRYDAPNICNIERRFCRNWKLSWSYTQQWCNVNKNYTYIQQNWNQNEFIEINWYTDDNKIINNDPLYSKEHTSTYISTWSGTMPTNSFIDDINIPNPSWANWLRDEDNITVKETEEQTKRDYPDCTTPRWEIIKHWQFVLAYKHANWFSDSPCESQIRLCKIWNLKWTYSSPTCKTRDTSFIDRINGSPTRDTYSNEKIELIKKLIKSEKIYDVNYDKQSYNDALDRILNILEK